MSAGETVTVGPDGRLVLASRPHEWFIRNSDGSWSRYAHGRRYAVALYSDVLDALAAAERVRDDLGRRLEVAEALVAEYDEQKARWHAYEERMDRELPALHDRAVAAERELRRLCDTWSVQWDCSATPGHDGMDDAVQAAWRYLDALDAPAGEPAP